MQNLILTPLLLLFFALSGDGQELSQTVRGTIIDANTTQNTSLKKSTDEKHFSFFNHLFNGCSFYHLLRQR
jgi:hypothetical protein